METDAATARIRELALVDALSPDGFWASRLVQSAEATLRAHVEAQHAEAVGGYLERLAELLATTKAGSFPMDQLESASWLPDDRRVWLAERAQRHARAP